MKGILLCVDDEVIVLNALRDQLRKKYGGMYFIEIAESAEEGFEILDESTTKGLMPLVIISDFQMPGMKGDEFLIRASRLFPSVATVMLSGQVSAEAIERMRMEGNLTSLLLKPWNAEELVLSIDAGLAKFDEFQQSSLCK